MMRAAVRKVIAAYSATAADKPPGSGWEKVPGGDPEHQGYRRPVHEKGPISTRHRGSSYEYWYPSTEHAKKAADFHSGRADKLDVESDNPGITKDDRLDLRHRRKMHDGHADGARTFIAKQHPRS